LNVPSQIRLVQTIHGYEHNVVNGLLALGVILFFCPARGWDRQATDYQGDVTNCCRLR
jgi:hypothetical protein